jgi:hypothetical protein
MQDKHRFSMLWKWKKTNRILCKYVPEILNRKYELGTRGEYTSVSQLGSSVVDRALATVGITSNAVHLG